MVSVCDWGPVIMQCVSDALGDRTPKQTYVGPDGISAGRNCCPGGILAVELTGVVVSTPAEYPSQTSGSRQTCTGLRVATWRVVYRNCWPGPEEHDKINAEWAKLCSVADDIQTALLCCAATWRKKGVQVLDKTHHVTAPVTVGELKTFPPEGTCIRVETQISVPVPICCGAENG